jgi:hypothetical protein
MTKNENIEIYQSSFLLYQDDPKSWAIIRRTSPSVFLHSNLIWMPVGHHTTGCWFATKEEAEKVLRSYEHKEKLGENYV